MNLAIILWALLGLELIVSCINLVMLWKQVVSTREPFAGLIPIQLNLKRRNLRLFLAVGPALIWNGLLWPMLVPLGWFLIFRSGVEPKPEDSMATLFKDLKARLAPVAARSSSGLVLGSIGLVLGSSAAIFFEQLRTPIIAWLFCCWAALALILLTSCFSIASLGDYLRVNPDQRTSFLAAGTVLFACAFPLTSSTLATFANKNSLRVPDVLSAMLGIYTLGGALWEGPKTALAKLTSNPGDILQLATGAILYSSIIAKIKDIIRKPNNDEILAAAFANLFIGDLPNANALIDAVAVDSFAVWNLRIVHSLMSGNAGRAKSLCAAKLPELGELGTTLDIASSMHLLNLTSAWKTPKSVQKEVWDNFMALTPSEEEFMLACLLLFSVLGKESYYYTETLVIEAAMFRDFFSTRIVYALYKADPDLEQSLVERAARECSLSPTVSLVAFSTMLPWLYKWSAEQTKELLPSWLELLSLMSAHARSFFGLLLVANSLTALAEIKEEQLIYDWLLGEREKLKLKLLEFPRGQELVAEFQKTFPVMALRVPNKTAAMLFFDA